MEDLNGSSRRYKGDSIWLHDLPENLIDIAHLKGLILHYADRLKELPENIGILANLTNLLMCASSLTNLENIGNLTNLTSLDLYDNRSLMGSIPLFI
jgi:Leucine-rich repeat (LRR) protein